MRRLAFFEHRLDAIDSSLDRLEVEEIEESIQVHRQWLKEVPERERGALLELIDVEEKRVENLETVIRGRDGLACPEAALQESAKSGAPRPSE